MISAFNPEGYDDRQVLHVRQLQINATYSVMRQNDKSGDAWISQDDTSASTDDIGDYFNTAMASKLSIDQVADDATILVPLFNIEDGAIAKAILASDPPCTPGSWVTPSLEWYSPSASYTRRGWSSNLSPLEPPSSFPYQPTFGLQRSSS